MAWKQSDLDALEDAIKQGVEEVRYSDKTVRYRSLDEMMKLRDIMRKDLGLIDADSQRIELTFGGKGLDE